MTTVQLGDDFPETLEAARNGSPAGWERLLGDLASRVVGYLRVRGARDPEATAGEVFLDVARGIHRFSGDEPGFRAWVFVIARRRLIDARRAGARRREVSLPPADLPDAAGPDSVEDAVMERASGDEVGRLLNLLTAEQAEVISLRVIAGFTIEETARVMGRQKGAIKALQHRGLAVLRRRLDAEGRIPEGTAND
jgi:RNA polymerase sigma factor (sigma-70 family)